MIQRYNAPESNNKYYLNVSGGGFNKCIRITGDSVLANCVGFAYGRFMESASITACNLSTGDAENWWDYPDGYERGQEPKQGAVMCWRKGQAHNPGDGRGHVEFVEQVNPDGSVVTTGSNYGGERFYRHTRIKPYSISGQTFQGFIYNPYLSVSIPYGASDQNVNGRGYYLYRQNKNEDAIVISAGLNKTLPIRSLDVDADVMCKITGANYFNMESKDSDNVKNPDPVGTTYGDISAPMSDVWRELPNQDTTLYFDMETGKYGDCTGIHIKQTHNVFSPSIVFPAVGNYQYARMVGIGFVNNVSRYSFSIRLTDGMYVLGLAKQDSSPRQISTDMKELLGSQLESVAFLDGGGSAQMGRVKDHKFEYVRETPRAVPSAVAIIRKKTQTETGSQTSPETGENEQIQDDTEKDEEPTMKDDTIEFEPIKDETWTDHEPMTETTGETILKRFLSVKSFVTLTLTGVFSYLSLTGKISQEQFMSVFTMCISFFFGYSFEKKTNSK